MRDCSKEQHRQEFGVSSQHGQKVDARPQRPIQCNTGIIIILAINIVPLLSVRVVLITPTPTYITMLLILTLP